MSGVVLCNQEIAESLDKQLRNQARGVAHSMERFRALINEARDRGIYPMLGFKSWTTYIADVIAKEMYPVLSVDDRRKIVALLADEGMSNRAIAETVGVNEITVRRDKDQVRHDVAPEALSSEQQAAIHEHLHGERKKLTAIIDRERQSSNVISITGRDGKTYPKLPPKQPSKPRRAPITDQASSVALDLGRVVRRLEKLAADDRFDRNREAIGFTLLSTYVRQGLKILSQLDAEINGS